MCSQWPKSSISAEGNKMAERGHWPIHKNVNEIINKIEIQIIRVGSINT